MHGISDINNVYAAHTIFILKDVTQFINHCVLYFMNNPNICTLMIPFPYPVDIV